MVPSVEGLSVGWGVFVQKHLYDDKGFFFCGSLGVFVQVSGGVWYSYYGLLWGV